MQPIEIHAEKYILYSCQLNRNQIVFTTFRLIWNQTELSFAPNKSEEGRYNHISVDLTRTEVDICVYMHALLLHGEKEVSDFVRLNSLCNCVHNYSFLLELNWIPFVLKKTIAIIQHSIWQELEIHFSGNTFFSFQFQNIMIELAIFLLFCNQTKYHLVQNKREYWQHDHIPLDLKRNQNPYHNLSLDMTRLEKTNSERTLSDRLAPLGIRRAH